MIMRYASGVIIAVLLCSACKTANHSSAESWTLSGNKAATDKFIIETITTAYPDAASSGDVLSAFAAVLEDAKTDQSESSDYVLQQYWQDSQNGTKEPTDDSPIKQYIVQEFLTQTNYLAVQAKTQSKLSLLPPTPKAQ